MIVKLVNVSIVKYFTCRLFSATELSSTYTWGNFCYWVEIPKLIEQVNRKFSSYAKVIKLIYKEKELQNE